MKTTFKKIFHNLIHMDFTIFCLQISIQIGNVSKQEKIYIKKQITIMVGARSLGCFKEGSRARNIRSEL